MGIIRANKTLAILILSSFSIFFLSENICLGNGLASPPRTKNSHSLGAAAQNKNIDEIKDEEDYASWKKKYEEINKGMRRSKNSKLVGQLTTLSGIAVALLLGIKKEKKGGGTIIIGPYPYTRFTPTIKMPAVEEEELNLFPFVGGIVLVGLGIVVTVSGSSKYRKAAKQKTALEEEGKLKGYLNLKVNPKDKTLAVSYTLEF